MTPTTNDVEPTTSATDVLQAVDQLRRDLSGYHGQLKAHNDLQRHCDHQRERIAELEAIHARDKAENTKLRELATGLYKCWVNEGCEGCPMQDDDGWCVRDIRLRDLGVEVSE